MAKVRTDVWNRIPVVMDGPVILDLDASLVEIHSDNKQGAAAHYKGGYWFHPLFCFADATGEALAGQLRPGNAAANDVADLLGVLLTMPSPSSPPMFRPVTTKETILFWWNAQWRCVLILRVAPKHSSTVCGYATSGSRSFRAPRPLYRQQ